MKRLTGWILGLFATSLLAWAEGSGDMAVVVYNSRMPDSKRVADHYASVRNVPAKQVIGLELPTTETMTRDEYRKQLQDPLYKKLIDQKVLEISSKPKPKNAPPTYSPVTKASVRYIVLCYGVPLKITADASIKEVDAIKLDPALKDRNDAAVDSELALLAMAREKIPLIGPLTNPAFGQTNSAAFSPTNNLFMVARLDGPTPEIALKLVDKAREAELNGMWGRGYFDARGLTNGDYKIGDDWIRAGSQIARRLGFDVVLDDAPATFPPSYPMSDIALYAGWYDGNVSGPFTQPTVEFMPGAFAYHLHSFSANTIRSAADNWVGPLLAKGATITMGAVNEPYLTGTPNIAVFIERLIHNRMTFGEAAYASMPALSWQMTVVGDPLYRPFGDPPDVLHKRLETSGSKYLEWSHQRVINLAVATRTGSADELIQYLNDVPLTKTSAVLTEKLAQLYIDKRRMGDAADTYARAATLNPSPLQKIRLLLAASELHSVLGNNDKAYEAFKALAATGYSNKQHVYNELIRLGKLLGKNDEVKKYEAEANASAPK